MTPELHSLWYFIDWCSYLRCLSIDCSPRHSIQTLCPRHRLYIVISNSLASFVLSKPNDRIISGSGRKASRATDQKTEFTTQKRKATWLQTLVPGWSEMQFVLLFFISYHELKNTVCVSKDCFGKPWSFFLVHSKLSPGETWICDPIQRPSQFPNHVKIEV